MTYAVNLAAKLQGFDDYWAPRIIAAFNGHEVMVVKVQGDFTWHSHPDTDDFFSVIAGKLHIEMPDTTVTLGPGELYIVPCGVAHKPSALEETHLMIIERAGTPNTGDAATAAPKLSVCPRTS